MAIKPTRRLDDLIDVDVDDVADGETIVWDEVAGTWEPGTGGGGSNDAEDINVTPAGGIAATDVQAALVELDSEKAATTLAVMDGDAAGGSLAGTYPSPTLGTGVVGPSNLSDTIPADKYLLGATSAAGGSSITLDRPANTIFAGGSYVAVGAGTSKCEIRRVSAQADEVLTLASPTLKYEHLADEKVWVLQSTWVTPAWFGCKAADSAFDSADGLMQASIEQALTGNIFGLTGHSARYYSSVPLCFYDNSVLDYITITAKTATFGIDPLIGERDGIPDQFFMTTAGQFVTVTDVDTTTNEITLSGTIGTAVGDRLQFYARQGDTLPEPLETGRAYYLLTNPSANVYTISIDRASSALDFTSEGSGTIYCFSLGNTRIKWTGVTLEGNAMQGLNGLFALLQQPARTVGLRVQDFPGGMGVMCMGGQESEHFQTMLVDGHVGLRLQGGQFHYFNGINIEDCDILLVSDDIDTNGNAGFGKDVHFWGSHWEQAGAHNARVQTIMGSAPVSAGTFTLTFAGDTTTAIAFNANAATIQTALEALPDIAPGDVTVTTSGTPLEDGGFMYCTFEGAYNYKVMIAPNRITIDATGLMGGTYTVNYINPDAAGISIKGPQNCLGVHGGIWSSNSVTPSGTIGDFLRLETSASLTDGYLVEYLISAGQSGYAINDLKRNITVPWGDSSLLAGGCSERLMYFAAPGRHGGTSNKSWWLAGRLGGHVAWEEYSEEFRINGTAKMRFGDTGPIIIDGTGTPEGSVTAPIGSLYLRTDGGTNTAIYRKESGTGNTGWIASTTGATGTAGGVLAGTYPNPTFAVDMATQAELDAAIAVSGITYPKKYKTGKYYIAPSSVVATDSGLAVTLDRVYYLPFPVGESLAIDRIACSVTTLGSAGAVVRLGIYSDTDGIPDARVLDAGTVDATTTGFKEITISQSLTAGSLYWMAICSQVAVASLRVVGVGAGAEWVGQDLATDLRTCNYMQAGVTGAFPANATPVTGTTQSPVVKVRAV